MAERTTTSYRELLRRISSAQMVDQIEADRLTRILAQAPPDGVAYAVHELLRRLVTEGRLQLLSGHLDRPGTALRVADPRRGHLLVLPDLVDRRRPFLRISVDPQLGPVPDFNSQQIMQLFHEQSRQTLSSVENSADVKGVLTGMLRVTRQLLEIPAAMCFTRSLAAPNAIASGLRRLLRQSGGAAAPRLPEAWEPWVARAAGDPDLLHYLPDLELLEPDERPLPAGSTLLVPLHEQRGTWETLLVALSDEPFAFDPERLARMRMFATHFRRQLNYAVRLQTVISHDVLTSAYNRSFFEDQLLRVIAGATRKEHEFALLLLDIDDFKLFNSRYGYDAGDSVLRSVAAALKRALRTTDVLARYGGEEFAIILSPPVSRGEAYQISERLLAAIRDLTVAVPTLTGGEAQVGVTLSMGGALFPHHGQDRDALWSEVNRMLLIAKGDGKDRVRFPTREDDSRLHVL